VAAGWHGSVTGARVTSRASRCGWGVATWHGRPAFRDPRGQLHVVRAVPDPPRLGPDPVAELTRDTRRRGARPDGWTAGARWRHEMEVPKRVWRRAMEAMARAEG
jgi:hypothetical protein